MTRKQALHKALQALNPHTDSEVIEKLNEILKELPFTGWSERTIFDTIDQFVLDNGRNPTATDFIPKGMPPHTVIKLRFGITLGEFLEKYYPQSPKNEKIDRDEQKKLFIAEYERIKPISAGDFNKKRADGVPTWATLAKMFGIGKWLEWVSFCGLEKSSPTLVKRKRSVELIVVPHNDLESRLLKPKQKRTTRR